MTGWDDLLGGELRADGRRIPLDMRYDPDEHALVFTLPEAGEVWVAVELTGQIAGPRP